MFAVVGLLLLGLVGANHNHLYYAIDKSTRYVGESPQLKEITACKDECMQMKHHYRGLNFRVRHKQMQFHRLILRQTMTDVKYFAGECQWSHNANSKSYRQWEFFPNKDIRWQRYSFRCGNPQLKLSDTLVKSLKLSRTHSDFLYYDTGRFVNNQPFDDLPGLFKRVTELQSSLTR